MKQAMRTTSSLILIATFAVNVVAQEKERQLIQDSEWIAADSDVLVIINRTHDIAAAYSDAKDVWTRIELGVVSDVSTTHPQVRNGLVLIDVHKSLVGRHILAYSSKTGAWGRLILPSDSAAKPSVDEDRIIVRDGRSLYVFGNNSTKWSGVDMMTGAQLRFDSSRPLAYEVRVDGR